MEIIYGIGLSVLEMTFIFVGLLILHGLRKVIGSAGFYIALGLLFVFTQLVGAAGLKIVTGVYGLDFYLSSSILLLPSLTALMVVYVADGTLAAQRLIIGLMASLGLYAYLAGLTASQSDWGGYMISQGMSSETLSVLMEDSMRTMAATVLAFTLDLFLIPIFFQRLVNLKCRLFISVMGSLMLVQVLDSLLYASVFYWGQPQWWGEITYSYISRALFIIWLSAIASFYLSRIDYESPGESRRTMDIIIAFFGTYGRAKALEQNLRETEEKYKILVQKAGDMIVIMDRKGNIVDANNTALKLCSMELNDIVGKSLESVFGVKPNSWLSLLENEHDENEAIDESACARCSSVIESTGIQIELSISGISLKGEPMLIVFGRDVTEKLRLEREREEWRIQMSHKQRLESIGQLAGGIAHDFNNFLHAIQGHLDIIKYMHEVRDEEVERHLDKIDSITEQASLLTRQLLGFARKGKYNQEELSVIPLVRASAELFMPNSADKGINLKIITYDFPDDAFRVKGDRIQLQQALLNLMFNSFDAMLSHAPFERNLRIRVGTPRHLRLRLDPPAEVKKQYDTEYCVIRVEDNGCGIPETIRNRIFEPFFTTKPVGKGTGMGLAMAYGTAMGHNGWIQCENLPSGGAAFDIVLPLVS